MGQRFRIKLSRVLPTFQSCHSKDTSIPIPPLFKRHVSSALVSVRRNQSSSRYVPEDHHTESSSEYSWHNEEKWFVVAKISDETPRRKVSFSGHSDETKRRSKISTSSAESVMFSSESCGSISIDSSQTRTIREPKKEKEKGAKRSGSKEVEALETRIVRESKKENGVTAARLSERMIACTVEGKVRESYAVVKDSEEPYEDFRRSMMEMILEKGMFEKKDLEQMLHCLVSLNSREHHRVIVQAFSQIWVALFSHKTIH